MKISIQKTALGDLRQGFQFYNKQNFGLGSYFLNTLYSDIDALLLYAGTHSRHLGMYRARSKRFPYVIYYEILDDVIAVRAILDLRRNPQWIEHKIKRL